MKKLLTAALVLAAAAAANAGQVVKWTDANGVVHFEAAGVTNMKAANAEVIEVQEAQNIQSEMHEYSPSSSSYESAAPARNNVSAYVSSPANGSSVRANDGVVNISGGASGNTSGLVLELSFDGSVVSQGNNAASATLTNVDRGQHTVTVTVKDPSSGKVIATSSSTFTVQKAHR